MMPMSFGSFIRRKIPIASVALLAVCFGFAPAASKVRIPLISPASEATKRKVVLGEWRLEIIRGTFSGDVSCRLRSRNKKIIYVPNALGFRFGEHLNVMDSWFRIDGGEARRWRDELPELARLGVAVDGRNLDAPTDGIVWIPATQLDDANRVAIQPRPDKKPRIFHLRGFVGLRDIARVRGCAPETRFVR